MYLNNIPNFHPAYNPHYRSYIFYSCFPPSLPKILSKSIFTIFFGLFLLFLLIKIFLIPEQKRQHRPDFPAVVLLSRVMLLQKRRQLFRVEILTGYGALKHFFNSPVPVVVPQPDTDRHRKSQLFPRGRVFRDVFPGHLPKQILRLSVGKFCLRRKCPDSLEHIPVQEGHAHLQRMGHAHAVGFLQNIPGQPVFPSLSGETVARTQSRRLESA